MKPSERGVTLMEVLISVTLLSLLSVGMLFALRVGLNAMGKTNDHVIGSRRVLGVDRVVTEQIAGFVPTTGLCSPNPESPPAKFAFFQGDPQTMRFVSTYSLQEAARGYPRMLEFQVIPGANGEGVRLVVNETLYTGPLGTGQRCGGIAPDPATGTPSVLWRPVIAGAGSFVLADKLARCQFSYEEQRELPEPDRWMAHWPYDFTPAAVRIDWAPLAPDASRLQLAPVTAPFRVSRHPFSVYTDP